MDIINDAKKLVQSKKYLLFDMDGTLVNLEELNFQCFRSTIKDLTKRELDYLDYLKYFAGVGSLSGFESYILAKNIALDAKLMVGKYREVKDYSLKTDFSRFVKLMDGVVEFLSDSRESGLRLAVATSTIRTFADFILKESGIYSYFDEIVTVDDVKHSKPNPEIFYKAMEKLGGNIKESVIFEDSPSGVQAARNSSMDFIIILTKNHNENVPKKGELAVWDYRELL